MRHSVLHSSAELELRNESCRSLFTEASTAVYSFIALVEAMLDDFSSTDSSTDSANESGSGMVFFFIVILLIFAFCCFFLTYLFTCIC